MPALCYMQCCYEIAVYKWFITHKHTNDLLNALLKCIKFYLYIHIVFLLTYLNCFIYQTYNQLFINYVFFIETGHEGVYIISHALLTPKATCNKCTYELACQYS